MVMKSDEGCSGGVTLTSIALLQKRFRKLQKMKELRQEKELLRIMLSSFGCESHGAPISSHANYELLRQKAFPGSQLKSLPPKPRCQLSLSLWPGSQNDEAPESRGVMEGSTLPWLSDAPQRVCTSTIIKLGSSCGCGGSDIDTSLRL